MGMLFFFLVLWAYHTLECTSTEDTPFSRVYRAEATVPVDVMTPSAHFTLVTKVLDPNEHIYDVEALEKKRKSVKINGYITRSNLVEPTNV